MNEYIKTGDIIPFEDNYIPEVKSNIPIYVKICPAKTEEEKAFYKTHKAWYINNNNSPFDGYIYKMRDIQNGTISYEVPKEELRHSRSWDHFTQRYTVMSYKYDKEDAKYLVQNIAGILVWRYFKYCPSYFKLGIKHGYYEVFRICFKDDESWIENRDEICNYNVPYLLEKHALKNGKLELFNIDYREIIKQVYPIISDIYLFSIYGLQDFCKAWNDLYKHGHIFKNTPQIILNDLNEQEDIGALSEYISRVYISKYSYPSHCALYRTLKDKNTIVCSVYTKCLTNIERVYVTDKKIYKFGWDSIHNTWVSTLRTTSLYSIDAHAFKKEDIKDIMVANKYFSYARNIKDIIYSNKYLWYEQWLKQGFESLNKYELFALMNLAKDNKTISYNVKQGQSFTAAFKNTPLHRLLGINSSMIKHIKGIYDAENFYSFITILNIYHKISKKHGKILDDAVLRLNLSHCTNSYNINKIVRILKKNNIEIQRYIRNILKRDDYQRLFVTLIDYWKFREKANKYNEKYDGNFYYPEIIKPSKIEFLHDKAHRDYLKWNAQNRSKKSIVSFEERFKNVVESEEYATRADKGSIFSIVPVEVPQDLDREGNALSHCVAGYKNCMSKNKSHIYFLRKNNDINTPYATIEVIPKEKNRQAFINQCYAAHDRLLKDKNAKNYVRNWCKHKHIDIKCFI